MNVNVNHFSSIYKWHPCITFLNSHLHLCFFYSSYWSCFNSPIHLNKFQSEWIALRCVKGLRCWQWMKPPCNDFWWNGFSKHVFNLTFTQWSPTPKHPILHQSLKPYYWPIEMCMIVMTKKKDEEHANDQSL